MPSLVASDGGGAGVLAIPTCRDVSEMVTDYLEEALPWRARLGMRFHLGLCSACRNYVDQMRRTARLLAAGPLPPPSPELERRIAEQARRERERG